jgi:polyadenylation factor subunit 2
MPESTISSHRVAIRVLEYNKSGDYLLSGDNDGAIKISNTQFRAMVDVDEAHSAPVRDLSFSPTDTKFVSGSDDLSLKIWDFKTHTEERKLTGHGLDVKSVDWHPSSALLLSGARDNLIKLWDPRLGSRHGEILTVSGHKQGVTQVAWNPHNGNWFLSASRDQSIRINDLRMVRGGISSSSTQAGTGASETGDRALHVLRAHAAEVHACAWHPVHEQVMASGGYDGVLMYWILGARCGGADSVTPMEETLSLKGQNDLAPGVCEDPVVQAIVPAAHDDAIWSMAWHPLGNMLCTGSNDHTCKFWSRERPGSDADAFYSGFNQRDVTELDVYERLQVGGVLFVCFCFVLFCLVWFVCIGRYMMCKSDCTRVYVMQACACVVCVLLGWDNVALALG